MNDRRGSARPIRFGIVAPVHDRTTGWIDQVRQIADWGYSTVLMPDVPQYLLAPAAALAFAAAVADIRVGTWVYASPVRPPFLTAWEAHSLTVLTQGRFELGLGTGRPQIADQLTGLGIPEYSGGDRVAQLRETVQALRALDGPAHTPVAMAVRGRKAMTLAAEVADTVTFPLMPDEPPAELVQRVRDFRALGDCELAMHIAVVGDTVAPNMTGPGTDPGVLREQHSWAVIPGDPAAAKEEIQRRHEELGFTYFVIGANSAQTLAPVVAELSGVTAGS